MLSVELVDNATLRLGRLPEETRRQLRPVMVRDGKDLAARVRGKLSGPVLKMKSGRLLNSIKSQMVENAQTIYVRVFSSGVPYAAIHEYGGQTRPHMIVPRNVQALHFMASDGAEVFARVVHHPGSKIPARSYLRSSLEEMRETLIRNMTEAGRPRWS